MSGKTNKLAYSFYNQVLIKIFGEELLVQLVLKPSLKAYIVQKREVGGLYFYEW
jgi:hypothetical protein